MAKKTQRKLFHFVCQMCKRQNYISSKSKLEQTEKVVLKKYCKWCKKVTEHKESSKLK